MGPARRNLKEKHGAPCALRTSALWFRWRSAVELHPGLQSISLSSLIEPSTFNISVNDSPVRRKNRLAFSPLISFLYPYTPLPAYLFSFLSSADILFSLPFQSVRQAIQLQIGCRFFFLFHMNHNNHLILTTVSCYLSTSFPSFSFLRQLPLV